MKSKNIVLIIPVYNKTRLTNSCLISIFKYSDVNPDVEVLVVDDDSDQDTKDCLKAYPITVLTNHRNCGYLTTTNRGIQYALDTLNADYIVLMNNDVEVRDDWLGRLLSAMQQYDMAGYSNAGKRYFLKKSPHRKTCYLEGSCMMVKREVFEKVGILDPVFETGYYSDDDLCLRAQIEGFSIGIVNNGKPHFVKHHGGQTFGRKKFNYMRSEYRIFVAKWDKKKGNKVVANYFKKWLFNPHNYVFRIAEWYIVKYYMPSLEKRLSR